MLTSKAARYAIAMCATVALLEGCSGISSQVTPASIGQPSRTLPAYVGPAGGGHFIMSNSFSPTAKRDAFIFFTDLQNNVVDIYPQRGKKMVGQITGLNNPQPLASDTAGNLYVANNGTSGVLVYAPPYTGAPKLTLPDSNHQAFDIAVSKQGVVAIANIDCVGGSCGGFYGGNVVLFPPNSTSPCATVNGDGTTFTSFFSDGFDAKGNLYVIGFHAGVPAVGLIAGGCNAKKIKQLTITNTLSENAFGIHVDKAGRIAIGDTPSGGSGVIYTFDPPKKGSLGNPVSTTRLTGGIFYFAFQADGRALYTSGFINSSQAVIEKYGYPRGGSPEKTITLSGSYPYGIAVTPPLVP